MVSKKENSFNPTVAIPPGVTIRDNMKAIGMDQEEFAERLGITTKHLSHMLNGKVALTHDMALRLEDVIGANARFWMNLESNYQLDKARLASEQIPEAELELLKEIPYHAMMENGWIEKKEARGKSAKEQIVISLRRFFAVASLENIRVSYEVSFRKQKLKSEASDYGTLAWLRQAEIEGQKDNIGGFDRSLLASSIQQLREQTTKNPDVFYPIIKRACADCGVSLVLVEALPKTGICGATIWRGEKAILALSLRGKSDDQFWFTFFHEIVHLLEPGKKSGIQYKNTTDIAEKEADETASNILIPRDVYNMFIEKYDYKSQKAIISYSRKIGIAPSILLGRLQHDKYVDYTWFADLKRKFVITNSHSN